MHISIRKKYGDMQVFYPPTTEIPPCGGRHHIDFFCLLIVFDVWILTITFPLDAIK